MGSRARNSVSHASNARDVHLAMVHNVKFDGYCQETN
jgi:hypothetical protein